MSECMTSRILTGLLVHIHQKDKKSQYKLNENKKCKEDIRNNFHRCLLISDAC